GFFTRSNDRVGVGACGRPWERMGRGEEPFGDVAAVRFGSMAPGTLGGPRGSGPRPEVSPDWACCRRPRRATQGPNPPSRALMGTDRAGSAARTLRVSADTIIGWVECPGASRGAGVLPGAAAGPRAVAGPSGKTATKPAPRRPRLRPPAPTAGELPSPSPQATLRKRT